MIWEDGESAVAAPAEEKDDVRARLLAAEPGRPRRLLLESHLREQVAQVLRLSPSRIESHQPLKSFGLDSLMAVELRNRLEASLGVSLSATLVFNYPTVAVMAPYVAGKMGLSLETESNGQAAVVAELVMPTEPKPVGTDDLSPLSTDAAFSPTEIRQLSDEDAEALLLKELEDINF
jgi:acyl carrier protein